MLSIPGFVDMAHTPEELKEEKLEHGSCDYAQPIYPYGLCLRLDNDSLDKLGLAGDAQAGDMIMLAALGKVTSVSSNETDKGIKRYVEIQITHLSLGDEHAEDVPARKPLRGKMYKE